MSEERKQMVIVHQMPGRVEAEVCDVLSAKDKVITIKSADGDTMRLPYDACTRVREGLGLYINRIAPGQQKPDGETLKIVEMYGIPENAAVIVLKAEEDHLDELYSRVKEELTGRGQDPLFITGTPHNHVRIQTLDEEMMEARGWVRKEETEVSDG